MSKLKLAAVIGLMVTAVSFFGGCKSTGGNHGSHDNHSSGRSGGGCH